MPDPGRVRIGAVEIEYQDVGEGEDVFLLVHGFTGSRDDWREQLPQLARIGRTVAIDQRGHGGSTNTGDPHTYTIEQMATDLLGFVETQGIDRFDLLGHSMGGAVALQFALANPDRVRSLVLMDTSHRRLALLPEKIADAGARVARENGTGAIARGMRARAQQGEANQAPAARRSIERLGFDAHWDRIQAKMDAMDPEAFAALGRCPFVDFGDRIQSIECPTLVIVGAEDGPFLAPSRQMAEAIPAATLTVIEGAAHSPQLENGDAWFAAIRAHLEAARS